MRTNVGAEIAATEAVAVCRQEAAHEPYAWARSWRTKRSAEAILRTENGEKIHSRLMRKKTKIDLLARLTHCGRNAINCIMRIAERPEGRLLTDTSGPCDHRLSGDEAGFRRSFELGRCVTGIGRADTANEIQDRAGTSSEARNECQGALRAR